MLGLSAVPAVIQFLGFLFLPESPRWLIQKGQTQRARRILSQMRGNQAIDEEYDSIKNSIEEEEKEVGAGMLNACWPLPINEEMKIRNDEVIACGNLMFWFFLMLFEIFHILVASKMNRWVFLWSYNFKLGSDILSEEKVKFSKILWVCEKITHKITQFKNVYFQEWK